MRQRQLSIAKITRPKVTGVYERKRLFKLLDQGRDKPVTWISGPAGSGKTTLINSYVEARKLPSLWYQLDEGDSDLASFFYYLGLAGRKAAPRNKKPLPLLTPEYQFGIPVFAKRYFEDLFSRFRPPAAVIFDNFQDIGERAGLPSILLHGMAVVPEGIRVIVMSRVDPPPVFASLRANSRMEVIGWDELRFDKDEARGVLNLRRGDDVPQEVADRIHAQAQGWAAGIVLMTEGLKRLPEGPFPEGTRERVFDYFAEELLQRVEQGAREFLMKSAFLPKISASAAEQLTGMKNVDRILSDLVRRNFFTVSRPGTSPAYEYHPLFREFLQARAGQSYSEEDLRLIQQHAAALLEETDQVEEAARLFAQIGDWERLVLLVLTHAPLLAAQGRVHTVQEWLSSILPAYTENAPWLIYWQGVSRMGFNPLEGRALLERAFALFKNSNDSAGMYLSWAGIIDTFVYDWSDFNPVTGWISEMESLMKKQPNFPSPEIEARVTYGMLCALMYRQPYHPDILKWADRATAILLASNDDHIRMLISSNLILYFAWWRGDTAKSSMLVDMLYEQAAARSINPVFRIIWAAAAAASAWITGESERSLSLAGRGLELSESTGVHVWDFMLLTQCSFSALTLGNMAAAESYLHQLSAVTQTGRKGDIFVYYWLMGWKALREGRYAAALEHEHTGLKITRETGIWFASGSLLQSAAETLMELGDFAQARKYLDEGHKIGTAAKSFTLEYQNSWLNALFHLRQGERRKAVTYLHRLLALSREKGIHSHMHWRPHIMAGLYSLALEEGIEPDHVRKLIRLHRLAPPESDRHREAWPWPVKIYALGRFRVDIAGKPLTFSGKVQKKPLELLKAIIALGGDEVAEGRITDALWPEAEGDAVRLSFKSALHRLRQLIGNDEAVRVQDGKVSLDRRHCWTDVWAFEHGLEGSPNVERADRVGVRDGNAVALVQTKSAIRNSKSQIEKAVALYAGRFLPGDEDRPWAVSLRERLRNKFLRAVGALGESSERDGKLRNAVEYYQKGLEADDLAEELYRRLMLCYQKLGRKADAVKTYERCRKVLAAGLGVEPSEETERVYASLRVPSA